MSDPNLDISRQIQALQAGQERLRKADVTPTSLAYAQRSLNPVAATGASGDFAQPWEAYMLAFYVSVFVQTTNNGTNFWTIDLQDTTGAVIASVNTSGVTVNTWTRLSDTSVAQPLSTNVALPVICTKTLTPGSMFIVPSVCVLRVGD